MSVRHDQAISANGLPSGLSIVIPAWNDAVRLRPTLDSLIPGLEHREEPFEIIVVADGCTDGTPDMVRSLGRENVSVLEFPTRLGKGAAIFEGLMRARFEKAGFLDADSPLLMEDLLSILERLDRFDGAISSRWPPGCRPHFHEARARNLLSVGWSGLTQAMGLSKVRDTQCGAKFFRTAKFRQIAQRVAVRGWAFDLGLLYHWGAAGFSLDEVPTVWRDDPGSKMNLSRAIPVMFGSLVALRVANSRLGRWTPPLLQRKLHRRLAELAGTFLNSGTVPTPDHFSEATVQLH